MRIVVSGGGTGGHIYPALAIAKYFSEKEQAEILYIGTERGMESDIVPRSGIPFRTVEVSGLKRSLSLDTFKTFLRLGKGIVQTRKILKEFRPDVVIGCGGYVVAPVVFTAWTLGIPSYIHEMDVLPGLTNRSLSRIADRIGVSFEGALPHFAHVKNKVVVAGNPRASEVVKITTSEILAAKQELGLHPAKSTVIVVSGSRGAKPINDAVKGMLDLAAAQKQFQLLYITGQIHFEQIQQELDAKGLGAENGIFLRPFVYNMPPLLAGADILVSRAGATTIAEATALGVPGIYIPSPYVTNNHQEYNARWLADSGAGILLRESDLTSDSLYRNIIELIQSPDKLQEMKQRSLELGKPEALTNIHRAIQSLLS